MLKTGETNIGNSDYWTKFYATISNQNWLDSLYSELLDTDLSGFVPDRLDGQPKTQCYIDAKIDNINIVYKYLNQIDWESPEFTNKGDIYCIPSTTFMDNIKSYSTANDEKLLASKSICKLLREIPGINVNKQKKVNNINVKCAFMNKVLVEKYLGEKIFNDVETEDEFGDLLPNMNPNYISDSESESPIDAR